MDNYIIIDNSENPKEYALTVSSELWKISVPVLSPDDTTKGLYEVIKHKDLDQYVLVIDLE